MKHCLHISWYRWYQIIIDTPIFGSFSNMLDFLSWFLCLSVCREMKLITWYQTLIMLKILGTRWVLRTLIVCNIIINLKHNFFKPLISSYNILCNRLSRNSDNLNHLRCTEFFLEPLDIISYQKTTKTCWLKWWTNLLLNVDM